MNKFYGLFLVLFLALLVSPIAYILAENIPSTQTDNCYQGKVITVELAQSHFTLDIGTHLKDNMNKVKIQIPVSCEFYDKVKVGDDLLKINKADAFRWGSFLVEGSVGNWKMIVVSK